MAPVEIICGLIEDLSVNCLWQEYPSKFEQPFTKTVVVNRAHQADHTMPGR